MPTSKTRKVRSAPEPRDNGVLPYHDMAVYENFERCASRVFQLLRSAQDSQPGIPRHLFFRVQGHRNDEGGFDQDSWEMMRHFLPTVMLPHLLQLITPLYEMRNPGSQNNKIAAGLRLSYPPGDGGFWYDVNLLTPRARERDLHQRRSPPSREAIADYLGMGSEACCIICWDKPAERAHVVPISLGGSMSVRNFARLCGRHHRQAPDIADAEAFWAWVDYAELRDSGSKLTQISDDARDWLQDQGIDIDRVRRQELEFATEVKFELKNLYGWSEADFSSACWDLTEEYHRVLDAATGKHFGVDKKVATHAWAYDVALRRYRSRRTSSESG